MTKPRDITGLKFGKLTVIKFDYYHIQPSGNKVPYWLCKCDCGNFKSVAKSHLLTGHTTSCGCFWKESIKKKLTKHNQSHTRLHDIWMGILKRCYNPNAKRYKIYGAKGIRICDEWKNDFSCFYQWAIENGYKDNLTIDRIDNNKNYEPENCRWVDYKTQARNKSSNTLLTFNGETHCISEWAEITGISAFAISQRLRVLNWSVEKTLTKPVRKIKAH